MTQILNNTTMVEGLMTGITRGAEKMELTTNGISSQITCKNICADDDCVSSYYGGCSLMGAVQTHVLNASGYISQISAALQQADQTVVKNTVLTNP